MPTNLRDNVYAYGRATFDWLNANLPNDFAAGVQARSGEQCLIAGMGDCEEQSHAFMSIMGVPIWYAFGALTDPQFGAWKGHGWAGGTMSGIDRVRSFSTEECTMSKDTWNNKWLQEVLS